MQVTSTQQNSKTKRHDSVELSHYLNNSKGFTLVELLISIAIIGILAAVGIPQYTQYKVRAYDAHSKQALHDMNLTCKAFWSMEDTSGECDLAKAKEHGFVQNSEVVANVLSTLPENFCASAKHNKSPNTYSSDYVGVVSDNADCGTGIAAELAAKKAEADRLAQIQQKYGSCTGSHEYFLPVRFLQTYGSMYGNPNIMQNGSITFRPQPNNPLLGYCVSTGEPWRSIRGRSGRYVNFRIAGCGSPPCNNWWCGFSSYECGTKASGRIGSLIDKRLFAAQALYAKYQETLETIGEDAAEELFLTEKKNQCATKVAQGLQPTTACTQAIRARVNWRACLVRYDSGKGSYWQRKRAQVTKSQYCISQGHRGIVEHYERQCKSAQKKGTHSRMASALQGNTACLKMFESGELDTTIDKLHYTSRTISRWDEQQNLVQQTVSASTALHHYAREGGFDTKLYCDTIRDNLKKGRGWSTTNKCY